MELLTTLGLSDSAGRHWLGKLLEIKYRLPRLWQRVLDGEVAPLAGLQDRRGDHVAPARRRRVRRRRARAVRALAVVEPARAHIEKARAEFDPEEVQRRRDADPRQFDIRADPAGIDGTPGSRDSWTPPTLSTSTPPSPPAPPGLGEVSDVPPRRPPLHGGRRLGRAQNALDLTDGSSGSRGRCSILMTDAQVAELRTDRHERPSRPGRRMVRRPATSRSAQCSTSTTTTASAASPHRDDPRAGVLTWPQLRLPLLHP